MSRNEGNTRNVGNIGIRAGGVSLVLLVIALICFVIAALGVKIDVNLVDIGLAFFVASFIF
mgnify:CR=1 FL=1